MLNPIANAILILDKLKSTQLSYLTAVYNAEQSNHAAILRSLMRQ